MLFLSHSTKDKAAAGEMQQRLLSRGYDPAQLFLDSDEQSGIAAGTKWEQVLYERLKDCRALVVLYTPNWKASQWCFAELVYAKMSGKEIFPVVLADGDLGGIASEHQAVVQFGERGGVSPLILRCGLTRDVECVATECFVGVESRFGDRGRDRKSVV